MLWSQYLICFIFVVIRPLPLSYRIVQKIKSRVFFVLFCFFYKCQKGSLFLPCESLCVPRKPGCVLAFQDLAASSRPNLLFSRLLPQTRHIFLQAIRFSVFFQQKNLLLWFFKCLTKFGFCSHSLIDFFFFRIEIISNEIVKQMMTVCFYACISHLSYFRLHVEF